MSTIRVTRKQELLYSFIICNVLIDGHQVGTIENGEQKDFPVLAGFHHFTIKINGMETEIPLNINANETKNYLIDSRQKLWYLLFVIAGIAVQHYSKNTAYENYGPALNMILVILILWKHYKNNQIYGLKVSEI